ncbi:MAG: hypothetical protein AAGI37_04845 [Planctomycetota bacterium]
MPKPVPNLPTVDSAQGRALAQKFKPPIDADPRHMRGEQLEAKGNEGLLRDAQGAAAAMFKVWGTVADLRDKVQDKQLLAKKSQSAVERSLREAEPKIARLRERRDAEQAKIKAMFDAGERDQLGREVRDFARTREGDSMVFIGELISAGDQRSVAAVLAAPAFLTGLTPEQQAAARGMAERQFAPEGTQLVDDLDRAIGRLEQTTDAMTSTIAPMINEWRGGDAALLQQLEGDATDGN